MTAKSILVALIAMGISGSALAEKSAKQAWLGLVGPKFAARPAFQYVENDPALPNVLIYGDSISIAYTQRTREALKGKANVYRLYCNGSHSGDVVQRMSLMHETMRKDSLDRPWNFQWDVVHFNVGLHDLKYVINGKLDTKKGTQVTSIEGYKENLTSIIAYLESLCPDARVIFATTTPVPENSRGRKSGDAKTYNAAALEVLSKHPEIVVNDLYSFTKAKHAQWWTRPNNVHFNAAGSNAQGDEVARVIREALAK